MQRLNNDLYEENKNKNGIGAFKAQLDYESKVYTSKQND